MNVKQAAAVDDEADFVFVVPVLGIEPGQHAVEAGRVRLHVDDVGGDVAAARFELVDLPGVGGENRLGTGDSAATSGPDVQRS